MSEERSRATRRQFLQAAAIATGLLAAGCAAGASGRVTASLTEAFRGATERGRGSMDGRLAARPGHGDGTTVTGLHPLAIQQERDALLFVPSGYRPDRPVPLVLMLHGAGGDAAGGLAPLLPLAEAADLALLAPASRARTWDVLLGGYGPDVAVVDQALATTFRQYAVDPARLAIAGFSDGASYALSVGLANGDVFPRIVAFAPGSVRLTAPVGRPEIFVTHGRRDEVLPIERCSRRIVPQLRAQRYPVDYREFDGGHTVPTDLAAAAVDWLAR